MNRNICYGLFTLLFVTLACRPVIAIGWNEFIFLFLLMAVLLGPPLYKLMRKLEAFLQNERKKK